MKSSMLLVIAALSLSACATAAKNPFRDIPQEDLATNKPAPLPADLEQLAGVYVDAGGSAMMWLKPVDGEMRAFIQDSLAYNTIDPEVLGAAMESNGKEARALATDWPYTGGWPDPKATLSYVMALKPAPGTPEAPPAMFTANWEFAHACKGQTLKNTRHEVVVAHNKTASGKPILVARIWFAPIDDKHMQALMGGTAEPEHQRTYLFAKLDEQLKPAMAQELADAKNFCRAE